MAITKETIFFSYSRADSEFVISLAKTLREAGANIWLDQLDIKPGTRWDKSIERALASSPTVLVIMSKTAVESDNVMDEVSFALEEGKKVVPVLLEKCDIPFRIRRLQFADFSKDQNKGIETLIAALDLDKSVATKLNVVAAKHDIIPDAPPSKKYVPKDPIAKPTAPPKEAEKVRNKPSSTYKKEKKSASKLPWILLTVVVLAAALYYFKDKLFVDKDTEAWEFAKFKDTEEEYKTYKFKFPNGKYVNAATDTIQNRTNRRNSEEDNAQWKIAVDKNTEASYDTYIMVESPVKRYTNEAIKKKKAITDARIAELSNKLTISDSTQLDGSVNDSLIDTLPGDAKGSTPTKESSVDSAEKTAWDTALNTNTFDGIIDFILSDNNNGNFYDEAISTLKTKGKRGWIYVGKGKNDVFTSPQYARVEHRNNNSFSSNSLPKIGDIVAALFPDSSWRIYPAYTNRNPEENVGSWWKTDKAYVLDVKWEGNTVIIQVLVKK
jgi:hypothetical protein